MANVIPDIKNAEEYAKWRNSLTMSEKLELYTDVNVENIQKMVIYEAKWGEYADSEANRQFLNNTMEYVDSGYDNVIKSEAESKVIDKIKSSAKNAIHSDEVTDEIDNVNKVVKDTALIQKSEIKSSIASIQEMNAVTEKSVGRPSLLKALNNKVDAVIDKIPNVSEKLNNSKVGKAYDKAKNNVKEVVSDIVPKNKVKEFGDKVKGSVTKQVKKVTKIKLAQSATKTIKQVGEKVTTSATGKAVQKVAAKTVGSTAAKAVGKSVLKKIPLISIGAGLVFGAQRAMAGDFSGAALEVASGAAGTFPGVGTAASVAIDAGLAGRDIYNETQKAEDATKQQVKTDTKNAKDYGEKKAAQARQASDKAKSKADNGKQATAEKMKANAKNANKSRKQAGKTVVNANKSKAGKATVTNSATKQKQYTQINKAKSKGRE